MGDFALPTTKEEHFDRMRLWMLERWDEWLEEALCRIIRRFVVFDRMREEADILNSFHEIHRTFVQETGSWYTVRDTYQMYIVLRDRFRIFKWLLEQPSVYHDPFNFTVHVPLLVRKLALKHWPLAMYLLNKPEPRWDVLKAIFEPLENLSEYAGEGNPKTPTNFVLLTELFAEYMAHLQGGINY